MITVDLPGLSLPNTDVGDEPYLRDTDWFDTADVKRDYDEREDGHGTFDQDPVYDQGFPFFFEGGLETVDPTAVFDLHRRVVALKQLGEFPVSVTDPSGTFTRMARINGRITYPIEREDGGVTFTVPLFANDPLRYGPEDVQSTFLPTPGGGVAFPFTFPADFGTPGNPGRITTSNPGDADAYSVLEITGGLGGGFSIVEKTTGFEVRLERFIPDGSTVQVDMATGQAFIDNQSPLTLARADFWSVPAGGIRILQFNSIGVVTGTPTLTARTRPAYH